LALIVAGLAAGLQAQGIHPALSNGVVTYVAEDGRRVEVRIGRRCADLWVSPDESVMAFIAIDRSRPAMAGEMEPFVEESTIYVARKADGFRPLRFAVDIQLGRRIWHVAREPRLAPDLLTLYFFVPNTMTEWTLVSRPLDEDTYKTVDYGSDYCVVWGGSRSGDTVILSRVDPQPGDPNGGVRYPCYARQASGQKTTLASECFAEFDNMARRWANAGGGSCR